MSQKYKPPKIISVSEGSYNAYSNADYGFVFSDNIEHWQSSRQLKQQRKNYQTAKTKRQQQ